MKVVLSNLSDNYLQSFILRKKVDNSFLVSEIDTELIYDKKDDFKTLIEATIQGDDKETGTLTFECNGEIEKDIHIKHSEGRFNLKQNIAEKKLFLSSPLDCLINEEINIFDYTATPTSTIQGTKDFGIYYNENLVYIGDSSVEITIEQLIALSGGIQDRSASGYFPVWVMYKAVPRIDYISGVPEIPGQTTVYQGHVFSINVVYNRIRSTVKYSDIWKPVPDISGNYFLTIIPNVIYTNPVRDGSYKTYNIITNVFVNYESIIYEGGHINKLAATPISNTYSLSEILEDIFICSGLEIISNFFGINPDASNPLNKAYDFATAYCQDVKICQSYDIIRESAIQDSFGWSGLFKTKELLSNLCTLFNLVIEVGDEIRIEHKSYFIGKGADFETLEKEYELTELEMNKDLTDVEEFTMAEATPTDGFYKVRVEYDTPGYYKEENVKNIKIEKFLTDVFGTINNEDYNDEPYKPLFYLLSTLNNEIIALNSAFSLSEIFNNLHTIERPLRIGKVNGIMTTFDSYSAGLTGEIKASGSLRIWDKLAPYNSVRVKEGTFVISEMEYNDKDELILKIKK